MIFVVALLMEERRVNTLFRDLAYVKIMRDCSNTNDFEPVKKLQR